MAGGDGSIAPAAAAAASAGIPLAVIPAGTANDFARELDLPRDIEEACRLAAAGRETRSLDLGRMGERPFVNIASAGLAPVAASEASGLKGRSVRWPTRPGPRAPASPPRPSRARSPAMARRCSPGGPGR